MPVVKGGGKRLGKFWKQEFKKGRTKQRWKKQGKRGRCWKRSTEI